MNGERDAVNPQRKGTKGAAHYILEHPAGASGTLRCRLFDRNPAEDLLVSATTFFGPPFDNVFNARIREADEFYEQRIGAGLTEDARLVQRQAFAGLLWGKQSYHYDVQRWLDGDPTQPAPDPARSMGRNHDWTIFTTPTSSPCRTNGNIPGTPPGIWLSTAWPWR